MLGQEISLVKIRFRFELACCNASSLDLISLFTDEIRTQGGEHFSNMLALSDKMTTSWFNITHIRII